MGLGFSIAGGKGAEAYIEGSESVFISKIAEGGPASRDGKLQVGDRLTQVTHLTTFTNQKINTKII
jgi:C-terminal processing protease CtpA/Prc